MPDPHLFTSTASYYTRYRAGYPDELFDYLVSSLSPTEHVLVDLGCGTGQVALPLAERGFSVTAIDPSEEMIQEGMRRASEKGLTHRIRWHVGVGEEVDRLITEPTPLIVMGASFHWMDRGRVLELADNIVSPNGGIALLFGGASVWGEGRPLWMSVTREVIQQFLGKERRAGDGYFQQSSPTHLEILQGSPFSKITSWHTSTTITRTLEEVIGLQLSMSYCSPRLLGDRRELFEEILRERLLAVSPQGEFSETVDIESLMATRP